ncbi:MAG TPA: hypothetical protein VEI73_05575 [Candidatus Acidoferrum sp.]|nr:hypothetical protein [Candidatus Acidoferrum sp.]
MILQLNHLHRKPAASTTQEVVDTLYALLEEGRLEREQFARLRVHLDWIQYRQNFRECVMAIGSTSDPRSECSSLEVHIDMRQVTPGALRDAILRAMPSSDVPAPAQDAVFLEEFRSFRESIAWGFNRLYWHRLAEWEEFTGRGYEQALPGGKSDANHPAAVADCVADFWTLLRDLESRKQLPEEIFVLEIGVGMGRRAGLWMDRFRALDAERGTKYYPRLRFLLGDYSLATLERSRPVMENHLELCSFVVLDALNPLKNLAFLRHKVLHIHLTNVYDNLPDEEFARREGQLYAVQVRAYIPPPDAARISGEFQIPAADIPRTVHRLLEGGPDYLADRKRGLAFWQEVWQAMRLEERLVSLDDLPDVALPTGLHQEQLEEALEGAPSDVRFHMSSGALESFQNTVPLLHPRGFLQVQDIFVTNFNEYRLGFHGPGKLDGSIVNWVNGVLLREVGERAGYDVHFAPFHYRPGSRTSVLYTTQRE